MKPLVVGLILMTLAACKEDVAAVPAPVKMAADAVGHYCQMTLSEHPGPKAQLHLKGVETPIFFSQVRDAIAYQRMPEQSHAIAAIYVSDMASAPSWEVPGDDNWIAAEEAHFVIGSARFGGMGAPELVPFSDRGAAEAFAVEHGGRIVTLGSVDAADVLPPGSGTESADDQHFIDRLGRLAGRGS